MRRILALVAVALLTFATDATADWRMVPSANFLVIGDVSAGQLRGAALRLEQFREVISLLHPGAIPDDDSTPVVVFVFGSDRSYRPFMPRGDGRVIRVAGMFQPGQDVNYITLSLDAGARAYSTIFHEYSHVLLRNVFADAPIWFNEGLAEYYRTFEVTRNGQHANVGRPVSEHLELLRRRSLPFGRLFQVDRDSPEYTRNSTDRDVLYAQAWAIVHHAFHGASGRQDQLFSFARIVAGGGEVDSAFREAYGIELADLEREIRLYVRRPILQFSTVELGVQVLTGIEAEVTDLSDAEADAYLGDLLAQMGRTDEAALRLETALAASPDLALAHVFLGSLRIEQGHIADGMDHLDQAFMLGTDNETALFRYARTLVTERAGNRDSMARASQTLQQALKLRPGYTEARLLLAYVHLISNQNEAARDLLVPVVRNEPANHRAALRLAETLLRLDDMDGATALLGAVRDRSTSDSDRERASALLAVATGLQARRTSRGVVNPTPSEDAPTPAPGARDGDAESLGSDDESARPSVRLASGLQVIPNFREVRTGEQRVYGLFEGVDCLNGKTTVRVRTTDAILRADTASLQDVEFFAYRTSLAEVACGPRMEPEPIYLTWRVNPAAPTFGTAVAIEILPEGFLPER